MSRVLVPGDRAVGWSEHSDSRSPTTPLKYVAAIDPEALGDDTDDDLEIRYIDISTVDAEGRLSEVPTYRFADAPSRARRVVRSGDTIFSLVRPYLRSISLISNDDQSLVVSTGFAVVRPDRQVLHPGFAYYWLRNTWMVQEVCARATGVSYPATNAGELGALPVPTIPLASQSNIAAHLDRRTAAIDALIKAKERLLGLLEERRAALVYRAVTQGVTDGAVTKDSGIAWIGAVPAHWRVARLRRVARRVVVGIAEAAAHAYRSDGVPMLRSQNVRENSIDRDDLLFLDPVFDSCRRSKRLRAGDLVTLRTGHAGRTAVVPPDLDKCQCFTMLITSLRDGEDPRFYSYFLNSLAGKQYFDVEAWGSAQPNISVPILQDTPVVCPPRPEQTAIVNYLQEHERQFAETATRLSEQLDRLREYRQALITAAVTGQIEVSEETAA